MAKTDQHLSAGHDIIVNTLDARIAVVIVFSYVTWEKAAGSIQ